MFYAIFASIPQTSKVFCCDIISGTTASSVLKSAMSARRSGEYPFLPRQARFSVLPATSDDIQFYQNFWRKVAVKSPDNDLRHTSRGFRLRLSFRGMIWDRSLESRKKDRFWSQRAF